MIKKCLSLLLVLCMLFSMVACNANDTTSNVSSNITPESTPTQTQEEPDEAESEISEPTPSETQSVAQPTPQPTPQPVAPQPQHTHSYTTTVKSATCTEQGYTTYTCSCGDTYNADYITPSHKYENYKCSVCGEIDNEHTYEYLVNWIIKYGTVNGEFSHISYKDDDGENYDIVYQASNNAVIFSRWRIDGHFQLYTDIVFNKISDTYEYQHKWNDLDIDSCAFEICGEINSKNFTVKTPISCKSYYELHPGTNVENNLLNVARYDLIMLLIVVEGILQGDYNSPDNSGLTLKDIGFEVFMNSVEEDL